MAAMVSVVESPRPRLQRLSGPRITGEGRNDGCGGSTDEDADEDEEDYDDMRYDIRVSIHERYST